jgi:MscS family membrane protein
MTFKLGFSGVFLCIVFLLTLTASVKAQPPILKEIAEEQSSSDSLPEESVVVDYQPGKTPLSTILAIKEAATHKNWQDAGKFIDMRYVSQYIKDIGASELVRQLSIVWSQQNSIDISSLSNDVKGHLQDNLPAYRDLLGILETSHGKIHIYLQHVPDGKGGKIWKISNATAKQVPQLWSEFGYSEHIEKLAAYLPDFKLINMNNWQFCAFVLLIICAWIFTNLLKKVAPLLFTNVTKNGPALVRFFGHSARMFLFFMLIDYGSNFLGLSLTAKLWITIGTLKYFAVAYLLLGLIEFSTSIYLAKIDKNSAAIIRPLMTTLKIIIVIIMALSWFNSAGYNIATILTGLGIGSFALALAAQKTLENVFGAFTLYIAKPIQPGDFCKFGDVIGTVEEIGLRSTRIRKLNRSVVHVPNAVFSSKELENYAEIDRRHYNREFRFRLDTSPDQLRQLLIKLRELLLVHERVLPTAARARFEHIERDAFVVVVNCYVDTKSIVAFKAVSEDLNLYILDIIRELGIQWAIPQQQILMAQASPTNEELIVEAQAKMDALRAEDKLPFPDFSEEEVTLRTNSLGYPREGTIQSKNKTQKTGTLDIADMVDDSATDGETARS